jgi:hypothetical protein
MQFRRPEDHRGELNVEPGYRGKELYYRLA